MRRLRVALLAAVASLLTLAVAGLRRARRRAAGIPLSPVTAGARVGADFPERAGLTTGEEPAGEMDDMAHYARDGFDPERVHPSVRAFYESTSDYPMTATVTWHRGFRLGAALAARVTSAVEQLNLPGPFAASTVALTSRFADVRADADPRDDVRAWVRTDRETGEAVFVALYGSYERDGERYVTVAVPLPWANLSTVLRLDHHDGDGAGATGVALTTLSGDDPGLYLVTPLGTLALPLEQRFTVRPDGDGVRATQTMWVRGVRFLTIEYDAERDA
ncbi:hypothetical protein GCM10009037_10220 [Halarchaeum grantii]|uniref:Uncharacterized protein n=1 Tax=Halarchaeum grantii TaxID=1193105 RepID=A0A830F835_9EURY|nr:hypothetical protein [Halarchaeum grantii]GGL28510.1 hypothetical protein GCM10009037_10220 [Halarchaeum grantii]